MPKRTLVIGHKNPDTDSIVSAVAYAELLRLLGHGHVVAARQRSVWPETRFILERFGLPLPVLVEDVRPRARDVMTTDPIVASPEESAYSVGRRLREHRVRAMSIVDNDHRLAGLITVEDLAHILLTGLDHDRTDQILLDVRNVVETLGGRLIFEARGRDCPGPASCLCTLDHGWRRDVAQEAGNTRATACCARWATATIGSGATPVKSSKNEQLTSKESSR